MNGSPRSGCRVRPKWDQAPKNGEPKPVPTVDFTFPVMILSAVTSGAECEGIAFPVAVFEPVAVNEPQITIDKVLKKTV